MMKTSDLSTRILALVLALALWGYVRILHGTPVITRTFENVAVAVQQPTSGWSASPGDASVTFTVKGPPDLVNRLTPMQLDPRVETQGATEGAINGRSEELPVSMNLPSGVKFVQQPRLKVTLKQLARRTFPVRVSFITAPPPGTTVGDFTLSPTEVTVEGPDEALNAVKYVTVSVDPAELRSEERALTPRPVNAAGVTVPNVTVQDSTVRIHMATLTGERTTRQVAVRPPDLVAMPPRLAVSVARVTPDHVTLSGNAAALSQLEAYVVSEPIDVSGLRRDAAAATFTTRLRVPDGLSVVEGPEVRVDLEMHPTVR